MPTLVPTAPGRDIELWNADEFLDWLEPGVHAELLNGKLLMHSPVRGDRTRERHPLPPLQQIQPGGAGVC
ncbi:MAG: hypothetical protein JO015_00030 [Verrucomicrobia bacterium]|nr:hypothetical protein [Verrucomicrobiota bacterium]